MALAISKEKQDDIIANAAYAIRDIRSITLPEPDRGHMLDAIDALARAVQLLAEALA